MKTYHVEFAIEVDADNPQEACKRAWELLSGPGAMLPVGEVIEHEGDGFREQVDLQELEEKTK